MTFIDDCTQITWVLFLNKNLKKAMSFKISSQRLKSQFGVSIKNLKIEWDGPMKPYCDNKSTISIAHNPV